MQLIVVNTPEATGISAATIVGNAIRAFTPTQQKPWFVLGLPTGSSPIYMYQELVRQYRAGQLSFRHVVTFNMDEYVGLSPDASTSYSFFMYQHFFQHIDIHPANIFLLDGLTRDPVGHCAEYEAKMAELGGVDLFVGGVGASGHLAFNEPGSSFQSRTRKVLLAHETKEANARFFNNRVEAVPQEALSVGLGTLLDAKILLLLIHGSQKADALAAGIEGPMSHKMPLSLIQWHPCSVIISDYSACRKLSLSTMNYFKEMNDATLPHFPQ